jgi:hypothetical protein
MITAQWRDRNEALNSIFFDHFKAREMRMKMGTIWRIRADMRCQRIPCLLGF